MTMEAFQIIKNRCFVVQMKKRSLQKMNFLVSILKSKVLIIQKMICIMDCNIVLSIIGYLVRYKNCYLILVMLSAIRQLKAGYVMGNRVELQINI